VLGLICQYHNTGVDSAAWESELDRDDNQEPPAPSEFSWKNILLACYRLFSIYLMKDEVQTQCAALRALGCMFVAQPRLMLALEQAGLIEAVMSEEAHINLQLVSLQCWRKILMVSEIFF